MPESVVLRDRHLLDVDHVGRDLVAEGHVSFGDDDRHRRFRGRGRRSLRAWVAATATAADDDHPHSRDDREEYANQDQYSIRALHNVSPEGL